jgi:hypothetical protein
MSDATDIDKAEYDGLRAEIIFHQTNASAVFGLNVVGMGVGITASSLIGAALLVLAVLACVLWFRYCDHLMAIFRIAAYLHRELRPRLVERLGEPVLGWELFLRSSGTDARSQMPRLPSVESRVGFLAGSAAFMLPPPLLCATFVVNRWAAAGGAGRALLVIAVTVVLVVWVFSVLRGYRVMRWLRATDHWLAHGTTEEREAVVGATQDPQ